jgi:hypothetical protein
VTSRPARAWRDGDRLQRRVGRRERRRPARHLRRRVQPLRRITPDSWHKATNGTPNLLFINQGGLTFREAAREWGVDDRRWSYAAAFADVNGDGKPDLYVANDFGENALFVNRGGRFDDEAKARGVLDPGNGMGADFGDYDNDGLLDLVVTNMSSTAGNRILGRMFPAATPQENVLKKLASGNSLFRNNWGRHVRGRHAGGRRPGASGPGAAASSTSTTTAGRTCISRTGSFPGSR